MGKQKKTPAKKYEVRLSEYAQKNINEITGYVAFINQQPLNAIKVGDKIFETLDRISLHPFAFRECEQLPSREKAYRRAVVLSWQIIFKIQDDSILILGILHSSRKPSTVKRLKRTP